MVGRYKCVLINILSPYPKDGGSIFLLIVGSAKQHGVVTSSTTMWIFPAVSIAYLTYLWRWCRVKASQCVWWRHRIFEIGLFIIHGTFFVMFAVLEWF